VPAPNGSAKFSVTAPPGPQLLELLKTVVPFDRLTVIFPADPPTGVTTANTMEFRLTPSGLGFTTVNCNTGTPEDVGSCTEFGGVPATVTTVSTGGVAVGVFVGVLVGVLVSVLVGVSVGVLVGVDVGVLVRVLLGVSVGVLEGVSVEVFEGVLVGVFVGVLVGVFVGVLLGVSVGVLLGVFVGVLLAVLVEVLLGVLVGLMVGVRVGVFVGVFVGVLVGLLVAVAVGLAIVNVAPNTGEPLTWIGLPEVNPTPVKSVSFTTLAS